MHFMIAYVNFHLDRTVLQSTKNISMGVMEFNCCDIRPEPNGGHRNRGFIRQYQQYCVRS